jgi:hypothetical protein
MKSFLLRNLGIAAVAAVGLFGSWTVERTSVERANRLQRAGSAAEAAALYQQRARTDGGNAELRYNLGTALLADGAETAEEELSRATRSADPEIQSRAQYNTGLLRLDEALVSETPDSVRINASASVDANRAALRIRPDDENAKWNLAMGLRLLDSIDAVERRSGREIMDGAMEADVVTRSVNVPDASEDERAEDPPAEGEEETVAAGGEEGELSLEEAAALLGRSHLDATLILGKLLALEGRSRWGRRPGAGVRRW